MIGSLIAVKTRAPVIGGMTHLLFALIQHLTGNFAVWGGLFSTFDCMLAGIRHKEDIINPVASGALTGAVLAARGMEHELLAPL